MLTSCYTRTVYNYAHFWGEVGCSFEDVSFGFRAISVYDIRFLDFVWSFFYKECIKQIFFYLRWGKVTENVFVNRH